MTKHNKSNKKLIVRYFLLISTISIAVYIVPRLSENNDMTAQSSALFAPPHSTDDCEQCHNETFQHFKEVNGNLSGQHTSYLLKQLNDIQSKKRKVAEKHILPHQIPPTKILSYAQFYTQQDKSMHASDSDKMIAAGKQLYNFGDDDRRIPACMSCHIKNGHGISEADIPALNGQTSGYIEQQLKNFRAGLRYNDKNKLMQNTAVRLTDQDITALAHYITTLDAQ